MNEFSDSLTPTFDRADFANLPDTQQAEALRDAKDAAWQQARQAMDAKLQALICQVTNLPEDPAWIAEHIDYIQQHAAWLVDPEQPGKTFAWDGQHLLWVGELVLEPTAQGDNGQSDTFNVHQPYKILEEIDVRPDTDDPHR